MAFCNKIGSLLRQGATQSTQAPVSSMLNYLRHMSSSKLFIGGIDLVLSSFLMVISIIIMSLIKCMVLAFGITGLSYHVDDQSLKDAFTTYGEVIEARVITDRDTGRSRGFGFVNFISEESATSALAMDGQDLSGRNIRVSYANDRQSGPRPGGGGYGGGGGGW